jgi:hypothetical protein
MLDIETMSSADAKHTLAVYQWISEHLNELQALAKQPFENEVSADDVQSRFHLEYTEMNCTRFFPMSLTIFTDEDALAEDEAIDPQVTLELGDGSSDEPIIVDHLHTLNVGEIVQRFGIVSDEKTFLLEDYEAKE